MRQKKTIIKNIKALVEKHGEIGPGETEYDKSVSTAQMESDSSPVLTNTKGAMTLCEEFGHHKVTIVHYVNDEEIDRDFINYDELPRDVLEEIEQELERYDLAQQDMMEKSGN